MPHFNVEIKARCIDHNAAREFLKSQKAVYHGLDHQLDTYFVVPNGRLKLRQGNIENSLIFYERKNQPGLKESRVILEEILPGSRLPELLLTALEKLVVVDKLRDIYVIDNVKFHLDCVKGLGKFLEIEAIDYDGSIGLEALTEKCSCYMNLLEVKQQELVSCSYSDMLSL